jgi:hypothetical protein
MGEYLLFPSLMLLILCIRLFSRILAEEELMEEDSPLVMCYEPGLYDDNEPLKGFGQSLLVARVRVLLSSYTHIDTSTGSSFLSYWTEVGMGGLRRRRPPAHRSSSACEGARHHEDHRSSRRNRHRPCAPPIPSLTSPLIFLLSSITRSPAPTNGAIRTLASTRSRTSTTWWRSSKRTTTRLTYSTPSRN